MTRKAGIILAIIILFLCIIGINLKSHDSNIINLDNLSNESTTYLENEDNIDYIYVHIDGAVNNPGIKKIIKGTRLFELIEYSSGEKEEADLSKVNLSTILKDEQKIFIPFKDIYDFQLLDEQTKTKTFSININKASVSDLIALPGVGEKVAQKIINYRNGQGYFNSIEELKNISGIGESKFNQIQEYITI